ncbi:MAG: VTT domain-containing protein [bacterium]|nr:VTT domain-containing protein [bacterium]
MERKPGEQINLIGTGLTIAVIVGLLFFIDIESLKGYVLRAGIWAPLVFVLLKISTLVIAPLSGSPLYPLVGLLFGFWPGILYVALGDFLGYTICFFISRIFGKKIVLKLVSDREESILNRIVEYISDTKGFIQACLAGFALPEILSYGAGLSRLPYFKFISILWPLTLTISTLLVFLGSILGAKAESVLIGLILPVVGVFAMLVGGTFFMRGLKEKSADKDLS